MTRVPPLRRADLVDAAFLLVLGVLAIAGFATTYDGWMFLLVGVAGLVVGVVVGQVAAALGQPMITVAAMTVAVFFLLGGAVVLRQAPTLSSLSGLAEAGVHGWKELLTTLPPVDGRGPLLVVPYILGLLCGAGGHTMARRLRHSAAPLAAPVAVLVAVILLGTGEPAALLSQSVVFGAGALCWAAVRGSRLRPAATATIAGHAARVGTGAVLLAVASAVAAFAGPALTGDAGRVVLRDHVAPPLDLGAYPSPLVGFRKYTKDANQLWDQTLLTVRGLPAGTPVRIATLDAYTGTVWAAGDAVNQPGQRGNAFQRVGPRIVQPATAGRAETEVRVTVGAAYAASDDVSAWLPTAGALTGVRFEGDNAQRHTDSFRYNLATSAGVVGSRLRAGDTYTFRAVLDGGAADPDDAAVGDLPADAQPFGRPAIPESAAGFVAARAAKWSGGAAQPIEARLRAVATRLREDGAYSCGGPGETQYLPGHSLGRLTAFLNTERTVGDDEQYAAVFALVANDLGMPARIVFGAVPATDGTVRGQDVHPWVEVHLADGRWAMIPHTEFTPDTSKKPDVTPPQQIQNTDASIVPPPNTVRAPDSLTDSSQVESQSTRGPRDGAAQGGFRLPGWVRAVAAWGGPPVLAIALMIAALVGAKARRRRRRRTSGPGATRFAAGWRELLDHVRDLGATVPRATTRSQQVAAILGRERPVPTPQLPQGAGPGPLAALIGDELHRLAAAADATIFGPGDPSPAAVSAYWQDVDHARQRLSRGVGRWRRWRAAISIRSLRPVS